MDRAQFPNDKCLTSLSRVTRIRKTASNIFLEKINFWINSSNKLHSIEYTNRCRIYDKPMVRK